MVIPDEHEGCDAQKASENQESINDVVVGKEKWKCEKGDKDNAENNIGDDKDTVYPSEEIIRDHVEQIVYT